MAPTETDTLVALQLAVVRRAAPTVSFEHFKYFCFRPCSFLRLKGFQDGVHQLPTKAPIGSFLQPDSSNHYISCGTLGTFSGSKAKGDMLPLARLLIFNNIAPFLGGLLFCCYFFYREIFHDEKRREEQKDTEERITNRTRRRLSASLF